MPEEMKARMVRLVLGDQLNEQHPWYREADPDVLHVLMEVRQETDYARHHVQKVLGFFAAMRRFAGLLRERGHRVLHLALDDPRNTQDIPGNLKWVLDQSEAERFAYQLPDEHRLDAQLKDFGEQLGLPVEVADTAHFLTERGELARLFRGKKQYLMERFYRTMRERTGLLMVGDKPAGGRWNFDKENRGRPAKDHVPPPPLLFDHDLHDLLELVQHHGVGTIGTVDARHFPWPLDRREALLLLEYFVDHLLPHFGRYQDALMPGHWALYHSRLSFALNLKLLDPLEVCRAVEDAWRADPDRIGIAQAEGFIRQVIGWREYMRGIYWAHMPEFGTLNFFGHERELPAWYWTGDTRMACLREAVKGSLTNAYAHHIQRLMVTGNFALLAGVHPDAVDAWYLGIYADAVEWVEITNTRGMSQFADGGIVGTKPYVSSGAYLDRMGHHCKDCHYNVKDRTGERACPFNALYWHFHHRNRTLLEGPDVRPGLMTRIGRVYRTWEAMDPGTQKALLAKAEHVLDHLDDL